MSALLASLILAFLAGLADLAGGLVTVRRRAMSRTTILLLTGLAAGFIVAAALLDRVPEAMSEHNPWGPWWLLVGFLAIYLVEYFFTGHAHDAPHEDSGSHQHALVSHQPEECLISPAASTAALLGLLLHTLFDGVAIAAGFMASPHTGAVMFLAVMFHKFPEGFSVAALMLGAGRSPTFAVAASGMLGVSTVIGAVLALAVTHVQDTHMQQSWAQALLSLATGTFLYIGCSDMIPATNRGENRAAVGMVLLGVALFVLSSWALLTAGLSHRH